MIAYCGLDCSKCVGFIATQSGDPKELERVAEIWSVQFNTPIKPEHVVCDGCKGVGRKSYHCANSCKMPPCCSAKGIQTCIECKEYPCEELSFILDNVPEAKSALEKLGTTGK